MNNYENKLQKRINEITDINIKTRFIKKVKFFKKILKKLNEHKD
jgi:hypothetical protein